MSKRYVFLHKRKHTIMKKIIRFLADLFKRNGPLSEKGLKKERAKLTDSIKTARREERNLKRELRKLLSQKNGVTDTSLAAISIQKSIDLQKEKIESLKEAKSNVNAALGTLRDEKRRKRIEKRARKNERSLAKLTKENNAAIKEFTKEKQKMQNHLKEFQQINKEMSDKLMGRRNKRSESRKQNRSLGRNTANPQRKVSFRQGR